MTPELGLDRKTRRTVATGAAPAAGQRLWAASWYLDFVSPDAAMGGFVRCGYYPNLAQSWWWAWAVRVEDGLPVVAGRQLEVSSAAPADGSAGPPFRLARPELTLELAASPDERRWTVWAEAPGSMGLELQWDAVADPYAYGRGRRYEQPGWARGTVTVDGRSQRLEGPGQRDNSWGVRDWWRLGWVWCAGWLSDGQRFQVTRLDARGRVPADGYVTSPDGQLSPVRQVEVGSAGSAGLRVRLDDLDVVLLDVATVPLRLRGPRGQSGRLDRSMCLVRSPDGRSGVAWRERNRPEAEPAGRRIHPA